MQPLFKKEEFLAEEWIPIGQDPSLWNDNILRIFASLYPELKNSIKNIEWIKISEEGKAGIGAINCNVNDKDVSIILLVKDGRLAPLDLYYADDKIDYFKSGKELLKEGIKVAKKQEGVEAIPVGKVSPLVSLSEMLKMGEDILPTLNKIKIPVYVSLKDDVILIKKEGKDYLVDSFSNIINKREPIKISQKTLKKLGFVMEKLKPKVYNTKDSYYAVFKNKFASIVCDEKPKKINKVGFYEDDKNHYGVFKLINEKSLCLIADDGRYAIGDSFEIPFIKRSDYFEFDNLPDKPEEGFFIYKNKALLVKIAKVEKKENDIIYKGLINNNPIEISITDIKKPILTKEAIYFPKDIKWKKADDRPLEFKKFDFEKALLSINKRGEEYEIYFSKKGKEFNYRLALPRAFLFLTGIGISPKYAYSLLTCGEMPTSLYLKGATIKVAKEKDYPDITPKIRSLFTKKSFEAILKIKKADEDVATKILSLALMKKENIADYLQIFETFYSLRPKLASMLLKARIGELDVSPTAIKHCLDILSQTIDILQELYTKTS